jgi:hypothetical protein
MRKPDVGENVSSRETVLRTLETQRKTHYLKSVPTTVDETTKDAATALFRLFSEGDTAKSGSMPTENLQRRSWETMILKTGSSCRLSRRHQLSLQDTN